MVKNIVQNVITGSIMVSGRIYAAAMFFPLALPGWMAEPESLLQYITLSQKAVKDMLDTEAIPRLSDEIIQNFMAAQTKIMAMA